MSRFSIIFPASERASSPDNTLVITNLTFLVEASPPPYSPPSQTTQSKWHLSRAHPPPSSTTTQPEQDQHFITLNIKPNNQIHTTTHPHYPLQPLTLKLTLSTLSTSPTQTATHLSATLHRYLATTPHPTSTALPPLLAALQQSTNPLLPPDLHIETLLSFTTERLRHTTPHVPSGDEVDYTALCKSLATDRKNSEEEEDALMARWKGEEAGRRRTEKKQQQQQQTQHQEQGQGRAKSLRWGFWVTAGPKAKSSARDGEEGRAGSRRLDDPYGGLM